MGENGFLVNSSTAPGVQGALEVVFCDGAGGARLDILYLTRAFHLSSCSA